jgi:malonic semialdehyde reductase
MWSIKQPPKIIFGKNSAREFIFPEKCLVVTSKNARSRGWLDYAGLNKSIIFDGVEPNPSIDTTETIISKFQKYDFTHVVGIGGGSAMDVAKYCAFKMNKLKIMIPTTFGSGSEVTRISVLKINGNKKSFHDDKIFADIAIVDSHFIENSNEQIIKNSAIDACAQCTESFDSKLANPFTKFLCKKAFNILEKALLEEKFEDLAYGAMISGLGFGNSSTTLGHALSYVFSNEGISHGHALAFTTTVSHKFNNSEFYNRFKHLVQKLDFSSIKLHQNFDDAAKLIQLDRKHLDYNPKNISNEDIIRLLKIINTNNIFKDS